MSGALGTIPYPTIDGEDGPLKRYQRQLDPLAKLTDQLWQTPQPRPLPPIQPPMPEPSLARLGMRAATGQQIMNPAEMTGPGGAAAELPPAPEAPASPAQQLAQASAMSGAGALARGDTAPGTPGGMLATGGPTDVTQFRQDPATGRITRSKAASARLQALAPDVPTGPAGGPATAAAPGDGAAPRSRSEERISTRVPSEPAQKAQGINAHATSDLSIGLPSLQQAPEALAKNAQLVKNYPGLNRLRTNDPHRINETAIQHMVDNLKFLHGKMQAEHGDEILNRSSKWYDGANKIAHDLASEYNIHPRQAAAVLAALSPQKDWYQNVDLARRVLNVHRGGSNLPFTNEMSGYAGRYIDQLKADKKDPETIAELDKLRQKFATTPFARLTDPYERAVWARWHDEAHNPRSYPIVTPEGAFGDNVKNPLREIRSKRTGDLLRTEGGEERRVTWGSFNEIAKAMGALQTGDLPSVSRLMGGNHKVRNFYNNIIAPQHGHDVTIDTHAIAAALLRPLGAGSLEVGHGLGTTVGKGRPGAANSATLGNKGMYGLYAEAYRRAARDLGLSPRQLQSITWEGVRGLFSPEQKRDKGFVNHVDSIWRGDGVSGKMTADQKRQAIYDHAGGMRAPSWAGGADYGDDE